ncbi:MAG: InlB B-repeat-containing protein [Flexilinea sp.]|nr:InlB B-repeat-containing protein [Flexilinea sp.]
MTIELNGYTIDRKMIGGPVFEVKGALIIGDSTGKGMITGGNADQGGGVYVADGGKFEMSGGTITGNKAAAGGSGVYVAAGGKFTLSGSPDIYGNISDNIYLCDGTKIEIESELNNTEPIGITMAVPGVFAEDNDPDHNNAGKFISDNPVYKVSYYDDGGKGYFKLESVDQYSIAAGVSPENSGTVIGGGTYFENTSAKVTAVPSTGYQFVNWTEAGKEVSTDAEYTFTVTKARNLVANFKPNNYTITAGVSPENSGTVTGAGTYDYGRSATLTATPAAGYRFVNWTEGGKEVSIDADYIFTVSGPRALTANFVKTHEISVEADPAAGGTVTGGDTYSENTSVTVTATPSSGYRFVKWTEGGSQVSNEAAYTFTVSGARSLTAHFEKIPAGTYSVTVIKEGQGSASASPDHGPAGSKVTLSAEPAEGYRFKEWQVVSGGVTIADDGTFTIGTENVSVKAVFQGYTYNGEGEDHLIASGEDAVFTIKRSINDELSFDKFKGIRMDGADVAPENYTAVRGSVVITLKAAYMDTLGPGQHTLTAVFEDGEAPVPFNVTESAAFEVPVDIVFVKNDSTRGVPFDVKAETLKPVLTIKDGEKVLSASKALKVEIEPGASDPDPSPTAYFSKEVKLEPGKYTVSVSGLPETIGLEIPDGDAKDAPKYSLTAKAEINLKDGKPVITLYLIFTPPALKIEEPVVYPLLEDEIGAYWLRKDGTKEYLLFHTYDICMSWLGKDELCRGYERCFHKDGK